MKAVSVFLVCASIVLTEGVRVRVKNEEAENILIVGDSITYGFGVKCEECKYRNILERHFNSNGKKVNIHHFDRAGASVQTIDIKNIKSSFGFKRRAFEEKKDKCKGVCSVKEMIKHLQLVPYTSTAAYRRLVSSDIKADKAVVFLGMNDANAVMYRPEMFEKNYKHLFGLAQKKGSPQMFVVTPEPICGKDIMGYYGGSPNGYHQRGVLQDVNMQIRKLAKELNATVIDFEKIFDCRSKDPSPSKFAPLPFGSQAYYDMNTKGIVDGELYRGWHSDNVHPNEWGASVMAKEMYRVLAGKEAEIPKIDPKKGAHSIPDEDKCTCEKDDEWYLSKNAQKQPEAYWPDN